MYEEEDGDENEDEDETVDDDCTASLSLINMTISPLPSPKLTEPPSATVMFP